jgi:DNA-binding CsgD family transcriptional regulator
MANDDLDPRDALKQLDASSPSEIRRNTVDLLRSVVEADVALFSKYSLSDEGKYRTAVEAVGAEAFVSRIENQDGDHCEPECIWDPRYPPKESEQSFSVQHYRAGTLAEDSEPKELCDLYRDVGVRWEASALLYDGPRFLGWLALYRLDERPFEPSEIEQLNDLVEPVVAALSRADRLEADLIGDRPARVLIDPSTHDVECATGNAFEWLTEKRKRQLTEEINELELSDSFPIKLFIDGFRVWVTQMNGALGMRYLATIERAPSPEKRPEAVLTPRQREVVGYAAAGATNREIAETLEITPDTVSDHLSAAYQRLGVANRVELALTLTSDTEK